MRRLLLLTLACALAPSAPAAATTLAPPGSHADTPFVAPGPGATALVTWRAGQSVQTAELGPSGFGAPRTVLQAPAVGPSPVGLLDPGDRTTVVAARGTRPNVPTEAVALLGDATERLTTGSFVEVLAAAGNE